MVFACFQMISGRLIKADTARAMRMHTREDMAPVYAYYYDYPIDGGDGNCKCPAEMLTSNVVLLGG